MNFKVEYGINSNFIDITSSLNKYIINNNYIVIPFGDHNRRDMFCCDPCVGEQKIVKITFLKNNEVFFLIRAKMYT